MGLLPGERRAPARPVRGRQDGATERGGPGRSGRVQGQQRSASGWGRYRETDGLALLLIDSLNLWR